MLLQDSAAWVGAGNGHITPDKTVSMIAYRSRAAGRISESDLEDLLLTAQQRNSSEGLTGLLIYDDGYFFQWLEGPDSALMRVWNSIRRDPRHCDIEVLREQALDKRFFASWDMRLARRTRVGFEAALGIAREPRELLRHLPRKPTVLAENVWDRVFADVVLPNLGVKHAVTLPIARSYLGTAPACRHSAAGIWHASGDTARELAVALLSVDGVESQRYVHDLVSQGAQLEALFREVFEPTARCLGGLYEAGSCDDLNLTVAMGRLQLEVRRLSTAHMRDHYAVRPGHAVLIAPQPGEAHGLSASMCSELFWRDGWDVRCEFPKTDNALRGLLRDQWFDVLDLSLSGATARDQDLSAMRVTIRAAHAASMNPSIAILVEGRSFFERPRAYQDVGADISCASSTDAVLTAQRLLDALGSAKHCRLPKVAVSLNHYARTLLSQELRLS